MCKVLFFICFMNCYLHSSLPGENSSCTPPTQPLNMPAGNDGNTVVDPDLYFSKLLKEQREQACEEARAKREAKMMNDGQDPVACELFSK